MNRSELIEAILKQKSLSTFTKKDADIFLATFMDTVKKNVKKGNDVSLVGFGSWSKARRKARDGRNPSTGEAMKIKAKNVVKFKAGKAWKEML
jgi:DNA-binding protein HU-beta